MKKILKLTGSLIPLFLGVFVFQNSVSAAGAEIYVYQTSGTTIISPTVTQTPDGTVTYDEPTNTLTLEDFSGTGIAIGNSDLSTVTKLVLKGDNVITNASSTGIGLDFATPAKISGDGKITVNVTNNIAVNAQKELVIDSGTFVLVAKTAIKLAGSQFVFNDGDLTINSASVRGIDSAGTEVIFGGGGVAIVSAGQGIYIEDNNLTFSGGVVEIDGATNGVEIVSTTTTPNKVIIDNGDITIEGNTTAVSVTNSSDADAIIFGDGVYVVEDGVSVVKTASGTNTISRFAKAGAVVKSVEFKKSPEEGEENSNTSDSLVIYIGIFTLSLGLLALKSRKTSRI